MIRPPKLSLASLPTPLNKLENLSKKTGKNIFIKRDDKTGTLLSGNKIKKLEYVLCEAVNNGADTIVTCGGLQSNHCRATMAAASKLGLDGIALLRGKNPEVFDSNTLLMSFLGAKFKFVTDEEYENIRLIYENIEKELLAKGKKPYFIPEGASTPLGSWGYIETMEEINIQKKDLGIDIDSIFAACGSGGTHAGLLLGKYLTGSKARIIGINVFKETRNFTKIISDIAAEVIEKYELDIKFATEDLHTYNEYIGEGYAKTSDAALKKLMDFAKLEGIILDHVYTGKAFIGMTDLLSKIPDELGENILFIHTGGLFGVFPEKKRITDIYKKSET